MKPFRLLIAILWMLPCLSVQGEGKGNAKFGAMEDPHIHVINHLRVNHWKTLGVLCTLKAPEVSIEAKSTKEVVQALEKAVRGIEGAEHIQFSTHKLFKSSEVELTLKLRNVPLACLIEYLCAASHTNAVIEENAVLLIPVTG